MNNFLAYFDLSNNYLPTRPKMVAEDGSANLPWVPQYLALFVGIVVQPYLQNYINSGKWDLSGFWGWIIAGIFLALIALPAVYKNSFDKTKPLAVQLMVLFVSGMGWQSIITVVKHVTKT